MKIDKIGIILSLLFFLLFNSNLYSQETKFDIVGVWNSEDYWNNKSKTIFSKDGYVSLTINGEEIDGKNFIIHGGPNDGQKAELKYEIDSEKSPIKIDLVAIKDNQEKGRILGIIVPVHHTKFLMIINFNGKRPQKIDDENYEQTLTLTKIQ